MWDKLLGHLPAGMIWITAVLAALIPLTIYAVNRKLHQMADPPWKKERDSEKKP